MKREKAYFIIFLTVFLFFWGKGIPEIRIWGFKKGFLVFLGFWGVFFGKFLGFFGFLGPKNQVFSQRGGNGYYIGP